MPLEDQSTLRAFLLRAKRRTYADQGGAAAAATPLVPGTRQLEYRFPDGTTFGCRVGLEL